MMGQLTRIGPLQLLDCIAPASHILEPISDQSQFSDIYALEGSGFVVIEIFHWYQDPIIRGPCAFYRSMTATPNCKISVGLA